MLGGDDGDQAWIDEVVTTVGLERPPEAPPERAVRRPAAARRRRPGPGQPSRRSSSPTSRPGNLDSRTGAEILDFMRRAVDEYGQTIVMVTHDPDAASYADRVVFLSDGRIVDEMAEPDGRAGARPDEAASGSDAQ